MVQLREQRLCGFCKKGSHEPEIDGILKLTFTIQYINLQSVQYTISFNIH